MEYGIICNTEKYILEIQLFDFNKLVKFSFVGYNGPNYSFIPSLLINDDINDLKKKSIGITSDQFYGILNNFEIDNCLKGNDFFKRYGLEELLI
jgi:hypothetical protein